MGVASRGPPHWESERGWGRGERGGVGWEQAGGRARQTSEACQRRAAWLYSWPGLAAPPCQSASVGAQSIGAEGEQRVWGGGGACVAVRGWRVRSIWQRGGRWRHRRRRSAAGERPSAASRVVRARGAPTENTRWPTCRDLMFG